MVVVSDAELVERVLAGEREAATSLFRRHLDDVYAFAYWRVGRRVDAAEDIAQETFCDAWRNLRRFDATREFGPWLCGIARRKLARHHRSAKPTVEVPDSVASRAAPPDASLASGELRRAVGCALTALRPRHRELLTRKYVESESLRTIGAELGMTEAAVSSGLQRARQAFRDALRKLGREELIHDVA